MVWYGILYGIVKCVICYAMTWHAMVYEALNLFFLHVFRCWEVNNRGTSFVSFSFLKIGKSFIEIGTLHM